jgi:hypothetical protein
MIRSGPFDDGSFAFVFSAKRASCSSNVSGIFDCLLRGPVSFFSLGNSDGRVQPFGPGLQVLQSPINPFSGAA